MTTLPLGSFCESCKYLGRPHVPGEGIMNRILILGEAPGKEEIAQNRPFVGRSGKLLRETLEELGVDPGTIRIDNACPCGITKDFDFAQMTKCLLHRYGGKGFVKVICLGRVAEVVSVSSISVYVPHPAYVLRGGMSMNEWKERLKGAMG